MLHLQIYQGKKRGQSRNNYNRHGYDQRKYQNRYKLDSGIGEFHLVEGFSVDKIIEIDLDMNRLIGMILEEVTLEVM